MTTELCTEENELMEHRATVSRAAMAAYNLYGILKECEQSGARVEAARLEQTIEEYIDNLIERCGTFSALLEILSVRCDARRFGPATGCGASAMQESVAWMHLRDRLGELATDARERGL